MMSARCRSSRDEVVAATALLLTFAMTLYSNSPQKLANEVIGGNLLTAFLVSVLLISVLLISVLLISVLLVLIALAV